MKFKTLAIGAIAALLLAGCNNNTNPEPAPSPEPEPTPTPTPTPVVENWPAGLQSLMNNWCGEVLPYVKLGSGLQYSESQDYYGTPILEIYDSASSFVLDDYGSKLESAGWNVQNVDEQKYMAKKRSADQLISYEVDYYFYSGYGNCLDCYKTVLSNELDSGTAWTEDLQSLMTSTFGELIPFVQLGKEYDYQYEENHIMIYDNYYQSLTSSIVETLTLPANGYVQTGVDEYGDPILVKTLADSSTITINPYYSDANVLDITFTPHVNTQSSWPSEALASIEAACGYTIPSYEATSYNWYAVGDKVVISSSLTTNLEETYLASCKTAGLMGSGTSVVSFEENVSVSFEALGENDSDDNFIVNGFKVVVESTTPVSDFYDAWPETAIENALAVQGITVDASEFEYTNASGKDYKVYELNYDDLYDYYMEMYAAYIEYGLITEEDIEDMAADEAGFYVCMFDPAENFAETYHDQLAGIPYYVQEKGSSGWYYAEDPTGKLGMWYQSSDSVFVLQLVKGDGEAHAPKFELSETSATVINGQVVELELTMSMLPGNTVEWSSSDESVATVDDGTVTIKTGLSDGATATITATLQEDPSYTASCVFTVTTKSFQRITSLDDLVSGGSYIIVNETAAVALDGASSNINAANNSVSFTTTSAGIITYSEALNDAAFTITEGTGDNASKYTIKNSSNKYIGRATNSNGLDAGADVVYNTISFSGNNVVITSAGNPVLQYNAAWPGFRYYKSANQSAIQLYKLVS